MPDPLIGSRLRNYVGPIIGGIMPMLWSAADVRKEYNRRHEAMEDFGMVGDEVPTRLRTCLTPGAHIITSPRGVRGTAAPVAYWDDFFAMEDRVAPVIFIPAGHIAASEAVRVVTLVKE